MANLSGHPPRLGMLPSSSSPFSSSTPPARKLHLLVAASGPRDTAWAQTLVIRLSKNPQFEMRAIVDDVVPRLTQTVIVLQNQGFAHHDQRHGARDRADDVEFYKQQAYELVEWADLLVCVPLDADGIAKMLAGVADTLLGEVLRGWATHKTIVLVPGMSTHMWTNPMTKRQLSKIRRKWEWIRVISPIIWCYEGHPHPKRVPNWNAFNDVLSIIQKQADFLGLESDVEPVPNRALLPDRSVKLRSRLPLEIWSIVFDFTEDWELAKALGIYTNLPTPSNWILHEHHALTNGQQYELDLEWTVLTCDSAAICRRLSQSPPEFQDLPAQFVRLIIRFALVDVLSYLEANRPDLFKAFGGTFIPTRASASYPRADVLEYWKHSEWFQGKHMYDAEAVDGASKGGHVHILDWWWRTSGFPLRYTEASLEQASANGHIPVLDWWRGAASQDENIVLRPGRALLWAAQYGQADVLRWWDSCGIPVAHGDGVLKVASAWGKVNVLEAWRQLKGDSTLVYDKEILLEPTSHEHIGVLEWWRRFAHGQHEGMDGRKHVVEFLPSSIDEALNESTGNQVNTSKWWSQYKIMSLGSRSEEWLNVQHL